MIELFERYRFHILLVVLAAGAVMAYLISGHAAAVNGRHGFPLDDPWIHLQFAKNFHDFGSFSYFRREMVTAGSTSPLYTFLLALGFVYKLDEMLMSYILGTLFLALSGWYIFRIASWQMGSALMGLGAALLLVLEPRMQWAALSGMETTLFIFLLLGTLYHYQAKHPILFGVFSGLLIWSRPEAVILYGALAADFMYHHYLVPGSKRRKPVAPTESPFAWLKRPIVIGGIIAGLYMLFNLSLSGSVFPNTMAAKLAYYGRGTATGFPASVFHFFSDGHMIVAAVLALAGIVAIVLSLLRRRTQPYFVVLLFPLGLFVAYWMKLPYLYQEGRYMMPVLPFVILLALYGVKLIISAEWNFSRVLRKGNLAVILPLGLIVVMGTMFGMQSYAKRTDFAATCKYISDRQVQTGRWLLNNTPKDAVIATHDIGAIAFYSRRKIVDMVGLVSPEMIERIGNLDALRKFLIENKVTHVAVLRNWFEVVNQRPLFVTGDREPGEIMEVFKFDPQRTHFTPQHVTQAASVAGQYLYQGQFDRAGQILQQAIRIDPANSKLHHLAGTLFLGSGNADEASRQFEEALRLNPDFIEARIGLAQVATSKGRKDEAVSLLNGILADYPDVPVTYRVLADVYRTFGIDSLKAAEYLATYNRLESEGKNR